jgi:hypothetical protein
MMMCLVSGFREGGHALYLMPSVDMIVSSYAPATSAGSPAFEPAPERGSTNGHISHPCGVIAFCDLCLYLASPRDSLTVWCIGPGSEGNKAQNKGDKASQKNFETDRPPGENVVHPVQPRDDEIMRWQGGDTFANLVNVFVWNTAWIDKILHRALEALVLSNALICEKDVHLQGEIHGLGMRAGD